MDTIHTVWGEEYDKDRLPGNPMLVAAVKIFLDLQKKLIQEQEYPPDTVFECKRCGDCCRWNYYTLNLVNPKLRDQLYMRGGSSPHGYWAIIEKQITMYMPTWGKKPGLLNFSGDLPPGHIDFLKRTGRMHGYWVLNTSTDKIIVYNPVPCNKLKKNNRCSIYKKRPELCRNYTCGRYPLNLPKVV